MMVPAGDTVESVISEISPLLSPGDVLIDGGNSHFADTARRATACAGAGFHFLGAGISGGEQGARSGASVMVGGAETGYRLAGDLLDGIAVKDKDGACVHYFGEGGAGHFVKMVHNGIEYAVMQAMGEAWLLLRDLCGYDQLRIAGLFERWCGGDLDSRLMRMSVGILQTPDNLGGGSLLDAIDDSADQSGTGQWVVSEAMSLGVPVPSIAAAVNARALSGMTDIRDAFRRTPASLSTDVALSEKAIEDALRSAIMTAFAEGFSLIAAGAAHYGWPVKAAEVAAVWRAGCILESRLLSDIRAAFAEAPDLPHLLLDPALAARIRNADPGWRDTIATAVQAGVPVPSMSAALGYGDALRTGRLWTALTQAQRDSFGAHGYRRTDREGRFHTEWGKNQPLP